MSYYEKQYRYTVGKLFGHDVTVEVKARDDTEADREFRKIAAFFDKTMKGRTDRKTGETMKITALLDEMADYEVDNLNKNRPLDIAIEELIYAYHNEGYDGHGVAAYLDNKGQWHLDEISHCSCDGALDEGFNRIGYTKEQVVSLLEKRAEESWQSEDYKLVLTEISKGDLK